MTTEQDAVLGGRYRLVSAIAVGGMGQVWRGLDQLLGRVVAVKVLKPELASDPGFLDRFRTEARHSAGLSHPSIATVYDYGEEDGSAYLVMELVPGEPLSDLLAREGALPASRAAALVAAAAHGLAAAHRAGLVHRDVKPGNLMVVPGGPGGASGGIKITDFGIARAAAEAPVTATGEVMGTAAYFAPEQAIGRRDITPAADLYALGVVLYEALAGRRPFTGDSQVAIALAQVNEPAPPLPAGVPHAAAALTAALLTKDPDQRPDDAAAVAEVAEALAVGDEALALDRLRAATPGGAVGAVATAGGWGTTVLPPDGTTVLDPHRTTGRRAAPRGAGSGTAGLGAAGLGAAGTGTGGAGAPWDAAPTSQPLRGEGVDERDPWSGGGRHTAGAGARGTGAQEATGGGGRGSRLTVPLLGLIAVALLLVVVAFLTGVLGGDAPPAAPSTAPPPATSSAPTSPSATEPSTTSSSEAPTSEPEETEPTAPPETAPPESSEPAPSETVEPSATSPSSTSSTGAPTSSSGSGTASGSSSSGSSSTSSASAGASGPTGATGSATPSSTAAGSLPGTDAESGTGPVVALPDASVGPRGGAAATVDSGRSDPEDGTG